MKSSLETGVVDPGNMTSMWCLPPDMLQRNPHPQGKKTDLKMEHPWTKHQILSFRL